ncbi:uncharacterized protein LOC120843732 [Ixodes scapularis]|uniref:uncharacterized protein LOC120843732 n=1 Tax=Ixodes scapularis TaxID=6945 RepID=UPI001A9CF8EC|nr:uncharacterized protein LOC120843732 [Ixodes scapularis]
MLPRIMKKSFILFYLKITEGLKLPKSTADEIVGLVKVLFASALQHTAAEIEKSLSCTTLTNIFPATFCTLFDADTVLDNMLAGAQTKYQREACVKASLSYTAVKEVKLQQGEQPKESFCYIPVEDLLKNLLTSTKTYNSVTEPLSKQAYEILTDFCGARFLQEKQQQMLKDDNQSTIFILLNTDEVELNNPLGAAVGKHKILLYFSILNLHARHHSKLVAIHLLLIGAYPTAQHYGLEAVMTPLIKDLNFLGSHGLQVGDEKFGVSAVAIVGDKLSMHRLMGISCSFSSGRISRYCLALFANLKQLVTPSEYVRRTPLSHASHQAAFLVGPSHDALYGITALSPLASLERFDVTLQLPPNAMHDILEGGIAFVLKTVLMGLVGSGAIKKEDLCRVAEYPYGVHDRKSKPVALTKKVITPSGQLRGTASQKWCLYRLFPHIFGDLIQENDEHWEIYLLYRQIIDIVFANKIPRDCIFYLAVLISDFLTLFVEQYPEKHMKPKLHYLLHYPEYISQFGPPQRYWAIRLEAKHPYLKAVASKVKNFKNIAKTLSHRHQLLQAYELGSSMKNESIQVTGMEVVETASLLEGITAALPDLLCNEAMLTCVETAVFNRCNYRAGDVFVITNGKTPQFGKINFVLFQTAR